VGTLTTAAKLNNYLKPMFIRKAFLLILSQILFLSWTHAQSKLLVQESQMPDLDLTVIDNVQTGTTHQEKLSDSNGKVRVVEFWATWCGSCIAKMGHLQSLKNQFPDEVEIIAISDEFIEKTIPFIQNRKFSFKFTVDRESVISKKFEVGALPFTIILDKKGNIKTVNNSEALTPKIIRDMMADRPVVFEKPDTFTIPNIADTAQIGVQNRAIITGYQPNSPAFMKDESTGEYAGRRVALYNMRLGQMVSMLADWGQSTMARFEISESAKDQLYCLDFIVDEENSAHRGDLALKFLAKRFPEKINVHTQRVKGYVLKVGNSEKIPEKTDKNVQFSSTATTQDLASEITGLLKIPVKNETTFNHRFILTMSRIPEDIILIRKILERIGLVLVEQEFEKTVFD
jgi:thiol-disulfide isomerase/thioredoxin